jgi:retron-type reverse transcriptase
MQGKAFEIPKSLVWQSYKSVKRNKGAPGCDGQTMKQFDNNRDRNLYKIWNRLCSGSYLPPPVREKRIPKQIEYSVFQLSVIVSHKEP